MGVAEDLLLQRVAIELGRLGIKKVLPKIDSATLRDALTVIIEKTGQGAYTSRLFIPHYWAVYYHDGRGAFGPKDNAVLVFFADPKDDPRIQGGYPERANDIRKLSRAEYEFGLRKNREAYDRGDPPYMIVTKSVGPAGAHPFFTKGMVGFAGSVEKDVLPFVDSYIQRLVDDIGPDKGVAEFRL